MNPVIKLFKVSPQGVVLFPSEEGVKLLQKNPKLQQTSEKIAQVDVHAFLFTVASPIKFVKTEHFYVRNQLFIYIWTMDEKSHTLTLPLTV